MTPNILSMPKLCLEKTRSLGKTRTLWGTLFLLLPTMAFAQDASTVHVDKADIVFMIMTTILVLFQAIPGVGLFYGGQLRSKNLVSVLVQSTVIAAAVMVIWAFYGYSFVFGGADNPIFGGVSKIFLNGMTVDSTVGTPTDGVFIPEYLFMAFQMMFAAITPVLIIGAFAERIKFGASVLFAVLWVTFVYFPIAHMVWDEHGFLFELGAIDLGGGTVVHINAGIAALVGTLMIGKRTGFGNSDMKPHSLTLTLLGAAILWFGWFGFIPGSTLEASGGAVLTTMNTILATAAAILSWSIAEAMHKGKVSLLGAASGMIAGLVAITPAAGTVGIMGAIVLGLIVSPVCFYFVGIVKPKFGYDDSTDVFGVHGIGGIVGALATGVLSAPIFGGFGGDGFSIAHQLGIQSVAVIVTVLWCGIGSYIIYKLVDKLIGLRVSEDHEETGLDLAHHGEAAYHR